MYPRSSHAWYELESPISYSNLTKYKHWNEEKILRKFTNEYFQMVIAKNVSIAFIFHQLNLFNSLINLSLSSILECSWKKGIQFFYVIPLWGEIDNATFYFLIFLVKIWDENSISIPIHLGIIYFWKWIFRGCELITRGFKVVTRGLELVTRGFKLVTRGFEIVTRGWKQVTRRFELVTCKVELITREFELGTHGFEFALLNFNSWL